jgi:amino acid adenylation domain-containing protein
MDEPDLTARLERLSQAKRALLELRLQQQATQGVRVMIPRRSPGTPAPLSFAQQRLWFLHELEPESAAYHEATAIRLEGHLDIIALQTALSTIVARHEILRSILVLDGDHPVQITGQPKPVELPVVELGAASTGGVQRAIAEIRNRPFHLGRDLMLRAALLRIGPTENILVLVKHHVASDGWSSGIFADELRQLYGAFSQGRADPLPPLPIQYADYAAWQRQWLQDEVLDRQVSFWREYLCDLPALKLPTDRPRSRLQSHRAARQSLELPRSLIDRLTVVGRRDNATLFMTMLAAFQILLHRYAGQDDFAVGSPIAGRTRVETEGLIGCFVNTLVLRGDLSGNPTFRDFLGRVRDSALKAYEYQDLPFEKLVEELNPERDSSRNPLFQVLFVVQNTPKRNTAFPGLIATPLEIDPMAAKFDLSAALVERAQEMTLRIEYRAELFEAATIVRMLGQFRNLLEAIAADPEQSIDALPLLASEERHQITVEWNQTQRDYPKDKTIQQLFEAEVERCPDSVALMFEEQRLTYRELNRRANQVAYYLRKLGVEPESLIGLCLERSVEMVVGLLGILKAGGAYVPLDPTYPRARLEFMLADTRASIVLTDNHSLNSLPQTNARIICLDRDRELFEKESTENPTNRNVDEHAAYVIYTSGSTGEPKGVVNVHAGLRNRLQWMQDTYRLATEDRVLQKTPFTFDVSAWEFLWPLISGACLVLARPEGHRDREYLIRLIQTARITTLHFVPSMLSVFLQGAEAESCTSLKQVFCSGEALPVELQRRFFARSHASLHNLYGPTEASIDVTAWQCRLAGTEETVPIGRPIANTQTYILDRSLAPLPVGVAGDLYIGGVGLARGYLNRPELTAEKFIASPFSENPSARLYKTGDRARYLPTGDIEFLGRIDDQVKIRGFRIELGEIEAVLGQISSVQDAAVLAREDVPGDRRLVAYVVAAPGFSPSAGELRAEILKRLPEYMVPSNFVFLQALPVNRNGKLDRTALPLPDQNGRALEQEFVAPRTPIEEVLGKIWGSLLKLDQVGVHDNFFQLGGHSLLATQTISRMNDAFAIAVPLLQFFETPTIAGVAASVEDLIIQSKTNGHHSIAKGGDEDAPLSFAQQRLWFLNQLEPESCAYNETRARRLDGNLNVEALHGALSAIVERHEVLRTRYVISDEGAPVQRVGAPEMIDLPVVDISALEGVDQDAEVRRLALDLRARPFDLANDVPLRVVVLRLSARSHALLEVTHHIATDGWSGAVFARELAALYERLARGDTTPLPELPLQYADYAARQRQWLQGEAFERQVDFWRAELRDLPVLELPTDRPRPAVQTYRGARQSLVLSKPLSDRLNALSRRENATLFMTLLAAFQVFLHRYCGQDDIGVGSPIAGRTRLETEGLIGCFVNTIVYRNHVSGEQRFTEFLAQVREGALKAYEHQDLPFEKLVEELNPERSLNHSPLFQVLFALQNIPHQKLTMPELTVSSLEVGPVTAKFDLFASFGVRDGQLLLRMEYNAELFDAGTIERMLSHCRVLLEGIVADPTRRVADLPVLTEAEEHQLLVEWKGARADSALCDDVVAMLEKQAERTPDACALVFGGTTLTYAELNRRANQLAHYLIRQGVRSETHVALFLERSVELATALLAVLKTGGLYVPLDPSYPRDRIAQMMEDLNAPFLVSAGLPAAHLPALGARVILLDAERENIAREEQSNPRCAETAERAAYVLYTSGSAGKPKGVVMSRGALGNLISWQIGRLSEPAAARTLQFAPCGFDVSIQEMLTTWCSGGSLFLIADEVRRDGQCLLEFLKEQSIERVFLPFVALQNLAEAAAYSGCYPSSLREIITAGEQLQMTASLRSLLSRLGDCCLRNQYGPTETHVATEFVLKAPFVDEADLPPIGRPITNAEIYILDSRHNPVPVGVPGEICIGGAGLALGYLNQPELTAEKFVDWSVRGRRVARLYKTGDRGRYLPDGNIEFVGRMDRQVKVRGFRIELDEVEAVLARCPGVHGSAVLALEAGSMDTRLVAYVVMREGVSADAQGLRGYLKEKLPEYMVPTAFVFVDAMPLTSSGKLNRAGLPAPEFSPPELYIAPSTPVEEKLAAVWRELLCLGRVGVHENFFDLGGHSLLATRLASRIKEAFGIELALRTVFELPTIAGLSGHIQAMCCASVGNSGDADANHNQTEEIIL